MKVILEVSLTSDYKVLVESADTIEDAKRGFDPCDDLSGAEVVGGSSEINEAYEVVDCPECEGRGRHIIKSVDFPNGYPYTCKKCNGDGYVRCSP